MKRPEYYNYWDKRNYKIGEIDFIKNRKEHPYRFVFIDWIIQSNDIKSILEVGPGEMVEYQHISQARPDIKYSIADVADLFLDNCKRKYPDVDTYKLPLEELDSFKKNQFDCIYQSAVFEHSPDIRKAIKNCIYVAKNFHFAIYKWKWKSGGLTSRFFKTKNLYSTNFNIWKLIEEIKKHGVIDFMNICTKDGDIIQIEKFKKSAPVNQKSGDYLIIRGRRK